MSDFVFAPSPYVRFLDPDTGLWRSIPRDTVPVPNGCRWCGEAQRAHGVKWVASVRYHSWEAPTDDQRKARMWYRRKLRLVLRFSASLRFMALNLNWGSADVQDLEASVERIRQALGAAA